MPAAYDAGDTVTVNYTLANLCHQGNIIVTLEHGNTVVASVTVSGSGTYTFSFSKIPNGVYNLVADNGSYKVTKAVTATGNNVTNVQINMDTGKTQSVADIVNNDTPPAAAFHGGRALYARRPNRCK